MYSKAILYGKRKRLEATTPLALIYGNQAKIYLDSSMFK